MAYSVSESDLVPMLAKCLLRHGTLEAVKNYPQQVSSQGGDATVCAEFIAMREISMTSNPQELISAAYEKAIKAATSALRDADAKTSKSEIVGSQISNNRMSKKTTWLIPPALWIFIAGICIWFEDEGTSPMLLASIVASSAYLFGCIMTKRKNEEREQAAPSNR